MKHIRCASVLFVSIDGKVLLVERKDQPGKWGRPTGKLLPDEPVKTAALREFLEETGLGVMEDGAEHLFESVWPAEESPPGVEGHTTVFLALAGESDHVPLAPREGEGRAQWFPFEALHDPEVNAFVAFDRIMLGATPKLRWLEAMLRSRLGAPQRRCAGCSCLLGPDEDWGPDAGRCVKCAPPYFGYGLGEKALGEMLQDERHERAGVERGWADKLAAEVDSHERTRKELGASLARAAEVGQALRALLGSLGEHISVLQVRERLVAILRGEPASTEPLRQRLCVGCGQSVDSLEAHVYQGCPGEKREGEQCLVPVSDSGPKPALSGRVLRCSRCQRPIRGGRWIYVEPGAAIHQPHDPDCCPPGGVGVWESQVASQPIPWPTGDIRPLRCLRCGQGIQAKSGETLRLLVGSEGVRHFEDDPACRPPEAAAPVPRDANGSEVAHELVDGAPRGGGH